MIPQLEAARLADPLDRSPATAAPLDLHVPVARHQPLASGVHDWIRTADAAGDADGAGGQVRHREELGQPHLPSAGQAPRDGLLGTGAPNGDRPAGGGEYGQEQQRGWEERGHRAAIIAG